VESADTLMEFASSPCADDDGDCGDDGCGAGGDVVEVTISAVSTGACFSPMVAFWSDVV